MQTTVITKLTPELRAIKEKITEQVISKRFPDMEGVDPEVITGDIEVTQKRHSESVTAQYDFVFRKDLVSENGIHFTRIVHVLTNMQGKVIDFVSNT
jgi:hypothetical protein